MGQLESAILLLQDSYSHIEYVSLIKTGKEAEVHLLRVDDALRALKIYKENTKFSSRIEYMGLNQITDARARRAIKNKTKAGREIIADSWAWREYKVLRGLHKHGASVPTVYNLVNNCILMDYVGDETSPAPRLVDVVLTPTEADACMHEVIDHMFLFTSEGFVHGDLSKFNILWHEGRPVIIDFPQIVYIRENRNAYAKFKTDLDNVRACFARYNLVELDKELAAARRHYLESINAI